MPESTSTLTNLDTDFTDSTDSLTPLPLEDAIDDIIGADLDYEPPSMFPKPSLTLKDASEYNQTTAIAPLSNPINHSTPPPNSSFRRPRQPKPNKFVDELHNEFIESLGQEKDLKLALSTSSNPKAAAFLQALTSPKNSRKSLTRVARQCGLNPVEIAEILRDYHLSTALLEIVKGAPQVAKDVVYDAQTIQVDCPRCGGFGQIQNPRDEQWEDCKRCIGTGMISKAGNSDARKLVSEAVGWSKSKSGGASIQVNINTRTERVESTIEELERIIPDDYNSNTNVIDIAPE
jgi:hypothetical protein